MGGGDLNLKKSWHTATLRNIEKVWKLETEAEDERKKFEILRKEKEKERQLAEFRRLHQQSTGASHKEQRMDWMYGGTGGSSGGGSGGNMVNAQLHEEYLLGRRKVTDLLNEKDKANNNTLGGGIAAVVSPSLQGDPSSSLPDARDLAAKVREDPLFMIKKKEATELSSVLQARLLYERNKSLRTGQQHQSSSRTSSRDSALQTPLRQHGGRATPYARPGLVSSHSRRDREGPPGRSSSTRRVPDTPSRDAYVLSKDDRQQRLQEMQANARLHSAVRSDLYNADELKNAQELAPTLQPQDSPAETFIDKAKRDALKGDIQSTLRSRRHYLQKPCDND